MSAFRFRLERVLAVRRTELELEEAAFERHSAEIARLDHARAAVQAEGLRAEAQIRRWSPVTGNDLAALSEFRLASRARENELALRRAEGERRRAEQKLKMLEARRRCRLLERLKDRRLTEWRSEEDRKLEEFAGERFLTQWGRRPDS